MKKYLFFSTLVSQESMPAKGFHFSKSLTTDVLKRFISGRGRKSLLLMQLAFLISCTGLMAQTLRTSVSSGNWGTSGTWSPAGVPGASDPVVISAGHNVTYSTATNFTTSGAMTLSGTLSINPATAVTFSVGGLSGSGNIVGSGGAHIFRAGSNNLNTTYSGVISGSSFRLEKAGTGTITLSAIHTFGGSLTINGGSVNLAGVGSLGSGSYSGNIIINGGILNIAATSDQTLSGSITGSGSIVKENLGTLTLSHSTNSYTGSTTVSGGELRLNPVANATVASQMILNGGTLSTTGITAGRTITSSSTLRLTATSTLALGSSAHTMSFANSSAQSWTPSALLTVNGWTGTAGLPGTAGRVFFGNTTGGLTAVQLGQVTLSGYPWDPILRTDGEIVPGTATATYTWNATTGSANWQSSGSWTPARVTPQPTDILYFSNGGTSVANNIPNQTLAQCIISNNTAVTLQSAATGNTLTIQGNAGTDLDIPAGSSLTLGNGANAMNLSFSGANHTALIAGTMTLSNGNTANTFNTANSTSTISGTLDNGATLSGNVVNNGQITFSRSDSYTYAGVISGAGGITKTGAGTLTLTGSHTFTGLTTISVGSLSIGSGSTSGSLIGNIENSASLIFNRSDNSEYPGDLTGTGTLSKQGAGTLNITGDLMHSGVTTVTAGLLSIGNGGTTGTISAGSAITNNSIIVFNRADDLTYDGVISGTGALRKLGSGLLVLTGANAYTGTTTLSAGSLELGASEVLPNTSNIILSGGSLRTGTAGGYTETVGTLNLTANSSIILGSGLHALRFAPSNLVSWTAGAQLSISGWQGVVNTSGTQGEIFFGNFPTTLTAGQLAQISFVGFVGTSTLLSTGELVAPLAPLNYVWNATSGTADWQASGSWTPARTSPSAADILVFGNGGSSTATNVPTQTISQMVVRSSTLITLSPAATGNRLRIQGGAGTDLTIEYGSGLSLGSSSLAMDLSFTGSGHLASLQGDMTLNGSSVFDTDKSTTTITGNNSVPVNLRPALYAMGSNNLSGNIINNGILEFQGTIHNYANVISGTGIVNLRGTPTVTYTGANTYTGASWIYGGRLNIGSGSTTGSIASNVFLVGGNLRYDRSDNITYAGTITANGTNCSRLEKYGAGALTLSGKFLSPLVTCQSYIYMYNGGIKLGRANVLSDSMYFYIWGGGNTTYLDLNGFSETVGGTMTATGGFYVTNSAAGAVDTITFKFNAGQTWQNFWVQNGAGTVRLQTFGQFQSGANNTLTGGTFVGAPNGQLYLQYAGRFPNTGGIVNNGQVTISISSSDASWNYGGIISGIGKLNLNYFDAGKTLTLSNRNTFTGGVRLFGGNLRLGIASALSNFCPITIATYVPWISSTFQTNGLTDTVGPLMMEGSGVIALGAGNHRLVFANSSGLGWNINDPSASTNTTYPPVTLTITGWTGTAGSSGTAGKIFFSSPTGLTAQQLSQITFSGYPNNPAILLPTGELVPGPAPAMYTWVATTGTANWQTPASWSPARNTPLATDMLQFSAGGTSTASNVPTQTIARILTSSNTNITLLAAADGNTLTLTGGAGTDLSLAGGTVLTLGSATAASPAMRLVQNGPEGLVSSIGGTLNLAAGNSNNTFDAGNYYTLLVTGGVINNSGTLNGKILHASGSGTQVNLNRTDNYTLSANLDYLGTQLATPTGRYIKNGAGTCTVTGKLTPWGGITISAGTLMIGNGGTSGSAFSLNIGSYVNNGVLIWNKSSNEQWFGGQTSPTILSGNGSLIKQGTGILGISSANTFSGGTTISAGVLSLGGGMTGPYWNGFGTQGMVAGNIVNNAQLWFTHNGAITYGNIISGSGDVDKRSGNVLTFTGANTYTGNTIIRNGGTIQLGNNNRISDASNMLLDRGIFRTGATNGFSETLGTLAVVSSAVASVVNGQNSTIILGTGGHTVRFANSSGVSWDPGVSLTISGWSGTAGNAGTAGRIFFGNNASGLTATQLSRITISGFLGNPVLLSTGELVPTATPPPSYRWLAAAASANWQNPASWTPARNTPAVTDILVFNTAGTFSATNVPTQTIERMLITNNMTLRLEAASGGSTLNIQGNSACGQLEIARGSTIEMGNPNGNIPMNLGFAGSCNIANIAGSLTINENTGGSTFNTDNSTTYMAGGTLTYGNGNFLGDVYLSAPISNASGGSPSGTFNFLQTSDLTFSTTRIKGSGTATLNKETGPLSTLSFDGSANAGIYYTINLSKGTIKPLTATALPDSSFSLNYTNYDDSPCVFDVNGFSLAVGKLFNGNNGNGNLLTNSGSTPAVLTMLGIGSLQGPVGPSWNSSVWRSGIIEDGAGGLSLAFFPKEGPGNCWNHFNFDANLAYTGTTTVYAGAHLQIGTAASQNIVNHGQLIFGISAGKDKTYIGNISGTGEVIKDKDTSPYSAYDIAGKITLSGSSTFTGTVWLGPGSLELGASEVLPDAATLVFGGFTSTTEAGTLSTGSATGYSETVGKLRLNANSTIALGSGSHTLTFANSSSEPWVGTTLTISNWLGTAGSSGTAGRIFFGSDATGLTAAQLNKISFLGFMGAAMLLPNGELVPAPVNPTYVWNPTTGSADFQVASNWTPARTIPGLDDLLGFTAGGSSMATNVPTQSIGRLIVANNTSITLQPSGAGRLLTIQGGIGSDLIVASGSTLTIGNGANSLGIQYFGSGLTAAISGNMTISSSNTANSYNSSSGAQTFINGGIMNVGGTLSGNLINNGTVIFNRPSGSYTYSDIISGTGLLDKQGSAVLIFGGSNTYSGETLISAGTLMLGTGGILPTGTALTVSSGAILDLNGSDGRVGSISGAGVITNSATGGVTSNLYAGENGNSTTFSGIIQDGASAIRLSKTGIGNLNLAGNNTYTGGTLVIGGVLSLGAGGASGSVVGNVDMGSSIYLFTSSNPTVSFNRSDDITYAGVISGTGTVTKQGANTVSLTGDHTYTGTTICSQGRLSFGNGGTTGSLTDGEIVNDATVAFNRSDSYIFNGFISGSGLAEKRGTGTVAFTNNQTYSGLTNIIGGTLSLGNNTTGGSVTGNISIQTTGRALVFHRSNDITYPGVVSSTLAGTLTKRGSGVLYLTGANTYSGNTVVNSGTLSIGAGGTTGSIANSNIVDSSVVIFDRSDAITYSRVISGPGAMRKQGAGTLTVSGANTYTGATFVTAGILQLSGNERISNFSRIELSGGTLRTGNGNTETVATLTLGSNSTLALGGTTVHNLNFSNSSAVVWSSGTTLTITGWQGIPGASGTGGKVFFGSASGTLSAQQLSQIVFQGFTGSPVLLSSGELVPRSGFAWLATSGSADWQTPSSWNPARTSPLTSDVLVFPNGGSSIATNVPTQTVAQILMFGNTAVTLEAASSANTLTMQGSTGNDLSIPLGSSFTIGNGANAMAVNFVGAGNATNVDGTLSLSNGNTANNFNTTNSTVLVTGTFNIGGSVTGNFANNGLVNFTGLNAYSHSGIISGTGAVTVSGTGPVTITGENTYTGLTTINSGSSLTVGDGSTAGTIAGSSGIANSGTLTFNHSDDYTYSNPISGTGTVNQVGTGLLTLDAANNQSGNFAISSGSLALGISSRLTVSGDFNATGTLIPNSSTLAFTGSSNSTISGNMSLYNLELNKSSNSMKLSLGSNISVSNELNMVSGDLDLNGSQLDLGNTGSLINETAASCVTGTAGGSIRAIRTLNVPSSENIAGLGAVLSSAQNLGSTEIIRRHNQVVVGFNYGMNRRYEIHPTNNIGLNATFVFQYFDGELITPMGTFNEADLLLWRFNGSAWEDQGGTVDVAANTITKTGIPQFSEWTSGSIDVPLPISLTNLKVSCGDLYPQLSWKSMEEETTGHFIIETSVDGQIWTSAGELPAGRKSKKVNQYSFNLENLSRHAGYVRLVLENLDGSQETFGPLSVNCISPLDKEKFNLFPNPSSGTVTLDLQSLNSGNIQVRVLNTVGEEVMQLLHNAVRSNKIKMDMKGMPAGIYQVLVGFEGEGKMQTLRLVVQ